MEAIAVRLDPAARNKYVLAQMSDCRDCYDTDAEWNAYQEKKNCKWMEEESPLRK